MELADSTECSRISAAVFVLSFVEENGVVLSG